MPNLKNKVALITGAASGIGQATAIHFASLGCKLSLVDLNPNFEDTLKQCLEQGLTEDQVLIQIVNLCDTSKQEELVNKTVDKFGQLDILVNCAGMMGKEQTLENVTLEGFDTVMDINFKVYMRLIHLSLPHLKKCKGSIVNVSSRATSTVYLHSLPYLVSKAGVDHLTRFAAKQLAPFGIRVNSVNPGSVKSNINQTMGLTQEQLELFKNFKDTMADPITIAKPIAFLCSDDASFITGVNLLIDGGLNEGRRSIKMPNLRNKVALITGAGSGIGRATAIHFASLGCKVSLVDLSANLEDTSKQCLEQGLTEDQVMIQIVDLCDTSKQEELVNKTVDKFGQLDILVNCAGMMGKEQTLENITLEGFDTIMDINFKVYMRLIHLSLPHLKKSKGSIVNISSCATSWVFLHSLPYLISKAGVDHLTRFAAKQLAPFGIRVNSVNPGRVNTNILQTFHVSDEEMDLLLPDFRKLAADPSLIAKPVAFLASEDASFITGVNLLVDGGEVLG